MALSGKKEDGSTHRKIGDQGAAKVKDSAGNQSNPLGFSVTKKGAVESKQSQTESKKRKAGKDEAPRKRRRLSISDFADLGTTPARPTNTKTKGLLGGRRDPTEVPPKPLLESTSFREVPGKSLGARLSKVQVPDELKYSDMSDALDVSKALTLADREATVNAKRVWASPKYKTPRQLLQIPYNERNKLNLKHRGLADGDLELHPPLTGRKPRGITWLVEYNTNPNGKEYICFDDHRERYGGPFAFLSNFYGCEFEQMEYYANPDRKFKHVEQFYQYCKARIMCAAPERIEHVYGFPTSSKDLHNRIIVQNDPNRCADFGRGFNHVEKEDPKWWRYWFALWSALLEGVLYDGLWAKFSQNPKLAEMLLMTGEFELVEAASRDKNCGIGFRAAKAAEARGKGKWGLNLLGKTLVKIRAALRELEAYADLPHTFAFDFWRVWEEKCNEQRYFSMDPKPRGVVLPKKREFTDDVVEAELEYQKKKWRRSRTSEPHAVEIDEDAMSSLELTDIWDGKYPGGKQESRARRYERAEREYDRRGGGLDANQEAELETIANKWKTDKDFGMPIARFQYLGDGGYFDNSAGKRKRQDEDDDASAPGGSEAPRIDMAVHRNTEQQCMKYLLVRVYTELCQARPAEEDNLESVETLLRKYWQSARSTLITFLSTALYAKLDVLSWDEDKSKRHATVRRAASVVVRDFLEELLKLWSHTNEFDNEDITHVTITRMDPLSTGEHPDKARNARLTGKQRLVREQYLAQNGRKAFEKRHSHMFGWDEEARTFESQFPSLLEQYGRLPGNNIVDEHARAMVEDIAVMPSQANTMKRTFPACLRIVRCLLAHEEAITMPGTYTPRLLLINVLCVLARGVVDGTDVELPHSIDSPYRAFMQVVEVCNTMAYRLPALAAPVDRWELALAARAHAVAEEWERAAQRHKLDREQPFRPEDEEMVIGELGQGDEEVKVEDEEMHDGNGDTTVKTEPAESEMDVTA
ncbi:hypothetical protein LTR37_018552 [Vermiconidia calcicola]|uniref:Uncharacterized protein n=1 Tax=Vermiconidia calcicola TaxID=1690605 RepID=A0ACC3MGM0_9PEZI|nr:hypothetical protein LTR37_018552 [Vermiconidia calcicola]